MKIKQILKISFWIAIAAGILILAGFINAERKKTTCKNIVVSIDYRNGEPLITPEFLKSKIKPDTLIGKKLTEIDVVKLEKKINAISLLTKADVYTTITGNLNIHAKQCSPIVRVYTDSNKSYYIDQSGDVIPVSTPYPSRILVANGNISIRYSDTLNVLNLGEKSRLRQLFHLAEYIHNDRFLKTQIEQVYVNHNNEFELVPLVGKHLIIFGNTDNMEMKFEKLMKFYKEGLNKTGWNHYSTVNLKYDNQVVCTKK